MHSQPRWVIAMTLSLAGAVAAHAQQAAPPSFPQYPPPAQQQAPVFIQQAPAFSQQTPGYAPNFTTQQPMQIPQIVGLDSNGLPVYGVPRMQVPLIQQSYYRVRGYGTSNGWGSRAFPGQGTRQSPGFDQTRPTFVQSPYIYPDGRPFVSGTR